MSEKNVIAGRYELVERIGDGGMAVVYKAKCRLLKRFVAVKILKPEFTRDRKFVDNFRREAHAAASLSHPNIVAIYDVGQEGNINYIVMELVVGQTLSSLIDEDSPMDYNEVIRIGQQIAHALDFAHKNGIVHRDVKPHNVLIAENGDVKITDFGIARAVSDTTIVDSTKENIMGSVHYFSPEMAKGEKVDERSDIYSFGIMLFEMLTGKVPFDGDNPVTIALMQINEDIGLPSIYNQNIPPKLESVVLKATEKNPKDRYQNFEEIVEELEEVDTISRVVGGSALIASEKDMDYIESASGRASRRKSKKEESASKGGSKKKKVILFSGAAILVILLASIYFFFFAGKDISVPDFKGMTVEEAEDKAKDLNIEVEVDKYESSDEFKKDLIISQDPEKGTKVRKGKVVKLIVSKGNVKGIVPNVVGKSEEDARKMIEQYGFSVGEVKEKESDEPKGTVVEQTPKGGSNADGKTDIDLFISDGSGANKVEVPNLLGMSKEAAEKALDNAGLKLGKVTTGASDSYDSEEIIWQSYNSGTKLKKGDTVDIKVNAKLGTTSIYLPMNEAKSEQFVLDIFISDDLGKNRHVVANKTYSKSGKEQVNLEGSGKGTVVVKFDGVDVLRKEVKF